MTVYAELSKALKLKHSPGDDVQAFLKKMLDKADKLDDKAWEKLSSEAQEWVNSAVEAHDSDEEIDPPEGLDVDDEEDDDDEAGETEVDDDEEEEEEEEAPKTRRAVKNGKAGKHATKQTEPKAKGKGKPGRKAKADASEDDEKPAKKGRPAKKAKATKEAKAKPEKKAKKGGNGAGRRERRFKDDQRITVLVSENPKRAHTASYERFELYNRGKKGMTVREALDAGVSSADLNWDVDHEFIKIE